MPLLDGTNLDTVLVTGTYETATGIPAVGYVEFTPQSTVSDMGADVIIVPATVKATLDNTGSFQLALPSTDDPDGNPVAWQYLVTEVLSALSGSWTGGRTFYLELPMSIPVFDLSSISPGATIAETVTYLPGLPGTGQIFQTNGAPLPVRPAVNFIGAVSLTDVDGVTTVNVNGTSNISVGVSFPVSPSQGAVHVQPIA